MRYYLLFKKYVAGKLEPDELEMMQEKIISKSRSPEKSANNFGSNLSFLNNTGGSNYYRGNSREVKTDRGLPLLNPQVNIGDITYSFKEKITINTVPNKTAGPTSQNFNIYMGSGQKDDNYQVNHTPTSRDPKYEFRRGSERPGGVSGFTQTTDAPSNAFIGTTHHNASKSFDFARTQGPAKNSSSRYAAAGSKEIYGRDVRKSTSHDTEPKSRKLLEMMLKRISKMNIDDEPPLSHSRSFARNTQHGKTWDHKSVSMETNKKKLHLTMNRNPENAYSRKSSRESQKPVITSTGVNSSTGFQNKPILSLNKSKPIQIRNLRARNQG